MERVIRQNDESTKTLITDISEKARNLYMTRQMLCTEAVLVSLNRGLNGGLDDSQALSMAAPFCIALGESGCLCGALSGAVMGAGLLLGESHPYRHRRAMRDTARQLHDAFKAANGATCCRALTRNVRKDKRAHFKQCADLTAYATELSAQFIFEKRPELAGRLNQRFLIKRETGLIGLFRRMAYLVCR